MTLLNSTMPSSKESRSKRKEPGWTYQLWAMLVISLFTEHPSHKFIIEKTHSSMSTPWDRDSIHETFEPMTNTTHSPLVSKLRWAQLLAEKKQDSQTTVRLKSQSWVTQVTEWRTSRRISTAKTSETALFSPRWFREWFNDNTPTSHLQRRQFATS